MEFRDKYTTVFDVISAGTLQKGLRSGSVSFTHRLKLACGHSTLQSICNRGIYLAKFELALTFKKMVVLIDQR